ncbi:MAG TPA: 4a-hydroxytetrahydrobiopterin dehydratase [Pseudonocardiaceae bacterium]|jgi:4a-hydroxytetrahydrobiopterin dehydratase|nr:4a-hydroxytetrahydrobiopterin dehydratase [Pseudonocardiaceae bacterium]
MSALLADDAIQQGLAGLSGWQRDGQTLVRTVELDDFPQAVQVVDRVAVRAEQANHHPDIDIRWRTLTFRCSTHSEGGITQADLDMASAIDTTITQVRG